MHTLLTANWTNLLVASFVVEPKLLKDYLPQKTELADWNGKFYMSLVGFLFEKPAFLGIPSPFFRKFEEINLRFYVRHKSKQGWRKGVVFIKEIAHSLIVGTVAKWLYGENFISFPTNHQIKKDSNSTLTKYEWKINQSLNYIELRHDNQQSELNSGSLESFIHDHYFAYTKGNTSSKEFKIEHRPWKVFKGLSFGMKVDTLQLYGPSFVDYLEEVPASTFVMDGSFTRVSFPRTM